MAKKKRVFVRGQPLPSRRTSPLILGARRPGNRRPFPQKNNSDSEDQLARDYVENMSMNRDKEEEGEEEKEGQAAPEEEDSDLEEVEEEVGNPFGNLPAQPKLL